MDRLRAQNGNFLLAHNGGLMSAPLPSKLFIGGISWETTDDGLRQYFSKYGTVIDSVVMREHSTGRSRGFGFVTFAESASVDAVMAETHVLDGKTIDPKRALPPDQAPNSRAEASPGEHRTKKIFIGGIAPTTTEAHLRDYFSQFGKVEDAVVMGEREGRTRRFGFVTLDSEDAVERAVKQENHEIDGNATVDVRKAEPKNRSRDGGRGRDMYGGYGVGAYGAGGYGGYGGAYGATGYDRGAYAGYGTGAGYAAYGPAGGYAATPGYGGYGNPQGYAAYGMPGYGAGYGAGYSGGSYAAGGYGSTGYDAYGTSTGGADSYGAYSNSGTRTAAPAGGAYGGAAGGAGGRAGYGQTPAGGSTYPSGAGAAASRPGGYGAGAGAGGASTGGAGVYGDASTGAGYGQQYDQYYGAAGTSESSTDYARGTAGFGRTDAYADYYGNAAAGSGAGNAGMYGATASGAGYNAVSAPNGVSGSYGGAPGSSATAGRTGAPSRYQPYGRA